MADVASIPAPRSPEWFAARRKGITATDIPKILGLSKYGNARSVWHDKRGELPPEPAGEAAEWGNILEPVVADEWARRHTVLIAPGKVESRDWMVATPDYHVGACPDGDAEPWQCLLEIKTRSPFVAGRWRDDMPDDVLAQVAWQRVVTGAHHVHVAALIGGQRLVEHRYDRDDRLEEYLIDAAGEIWGHVIEGTPPPVDYDTLLAQVLDLVMVDRSGQTDVDIVRARDLEDRYLAARAAEAAAKQAKDAARAAILDALGAGDTLTAEGVRRFTYKPQERRGISLDALRKADPELLQRLADGGHITTTTSRVLRHYKGGDDE